jgi:hypothetical protein
MRSMRLAPALLMIATAASPCLALQSQSDRPERVVPAPVRALTVTGCLARGVEPNTFVLKNVAWPSPKTGSQGHARGSAPATSPVSPPATAETLRLAGAASALGLDAYVGHTISAAGTLAKTDPPVTPGVVLPEPQGDTTSRTRAAEEQAASTLRTFEMRSMTDVAPECR